MLFYTIIKVEEPMEAYMVTAKIDINSRSVYEMPEYPRCDIKFPMFKFQDRNTVENIAQMDFSTER